MGFVEAMAGRRTAGVVAGGEFICEEGGEDVGLLILLDAEAARDWDVEPG